MRYNYGHRFLSLVTKKKKKKKTTTNNPKTTTKKFKKITDTTKLNRHNQSDDSEI